MMNMKNLVVKTNRLVNAIQTLSLAETRLVQLAIVDARETGLGLNSDKPLKISAQRYADIFGVTPQTAYEALLDAEKSLFDRQFSFIDDLGERVKTRWIQDVRYGKTQGFIRITFTHNVINEITRIDGFEQHFTKYYLEQTSKLKSVYAIRLYELLLSWRGEPNNIPMFELKQFREQLGLQPNEYKTMCNFKIRVLDAGIKQINDLTDIITEYEQVKEGRTIVGFKFKFRFKKALIDVTPKILPPTDENTPDFFTGLTNKQINHFANLLANDAVFGSEYAGIGEEVPAFMARIKDDLRDTLKIEKYLPHLQRLGFKNSYQ